MVEMLFEDSFNQGLVVMLFETLNIYKKKCLKFNQGMGEMLFED